MRTVKGYIETSVNGSRVEFEFQVEDETAPEEVEEHAKEAAFGLLEWSFTIEPEEPQ